MVWLAREDLVRAVQLLQQHHARKLVRQRHRPQRQPQVAFVEVEPARPADYEAEILRRLPPLLEEAAEGHRVELAAVAREPAHVRAVRDAARDALVLAYLHEIDSRLTGD